jgi:hypothetical protein
LSYLQAARGFKKTAAQHLSEGAREEKGREFEREVETREFERERLQEESSREREREAERRDLERAGRSNRGGYRTTRPQSGAGQ